ncbi:class I SAM-dependent methyltransferase [Profundibacter sp.]|uniref:class I SAM-dependent methyltransferase n=1 Tax=Profundibacter sp. TaxID=3101071 RepID=UPI003D0E835A
MVASQERVKELDSLRETFGAERVAQDERRGAVRALFDRIAPRYDLMNDLMSFGLHRLWKRATVRVALKRLQGMNGPLIDLAGGTGDIAFGVKAADPARKVIVADASAGMLDVARTRGGGSVEYLHAEAEDMPLEDYSALATFCFTAR